MCYQVVEGLLGLRMFILSAFSCEMITLPWPRCHPENHQNRICLFNPLEALTLRGRLIGRCGWKSGARLRQQLRRRRPRKRLESRIHQ